MWKTAFAALLLIASTAGAAADYYYPFATNGREFWRPASQAPAGTSLHVVSGSITLKTHCFTSSMTFRNMNGKAVFEGEYASSMSSAPKCAVERPGFESLKRTIMGVTGSRASAEGMVLQAADAGDAMALAPIAPDSIEFRRLTVTAFRYRGKLVPLRDPHFVPNFVLYGGDVEGSSGCGGFMGGYQKLGPSRYKFGVGSVLAGMCDDIDRALWRVDKICTAIDGVRYVEARGDDFLLRDRRGREQLVLSPLAEGEIH